MLRRCCRCQIRLKNSLLTDPQPVASLEFIVCTTTSSELWVQAYHSFTLNTSTAPQSELAKVGSYSWSFYAASQSPSGPVRPSSPGEPKFCPSILRALEIHLAGLHYPTLAERNILIFNVCLWLLVRVDRKMCVCVCVCIQLKEPLVYCAIKCFKIYEYL
jgi:hypothetical protein